MSKRSIPFRVAYKVTGYVMAVGDRCKQFGQQLCDGVDKWYDQRDQRKKRETQRPAGEPEKVFCSACHNEYRVENGECIECGAVR